MKRIDNPDAIEICLFDGVESSAVYLGGMDWLTHVTNDITWRTEDHTPYDTSSPCKVLTLGEIAEQLRLRAIIITVIVIGPMSGVVYQYGNYGDSWWEVGTLDGYA